jgi:hypothetical protein
LAGEVLNLAGRSPEETPIDAPDDPTSGGQYDSPARHGVASMVRLA